VASPKKLKTMNTEVNNLKDDATYFCEVRNKKGEKVKDEMIEITGEELKALTEMQGFKNGMVRYNKMLFYDVIEEKPTIKA
jgi:hypothetical protein